MSKQKNRERPHPSAWPCEWMNGHIHSTIIHHAPHYVTSFFQTDGHIRKQSSQSSLPHGALILAGHMYFVPYLLMMRQCPCGQDFESSWASRNHPPRSSQCSCVKKKKTGLGQLRDSTSIWDLWRKKSQTVSVILGYLFTFIAGWDSGGTKVIDTWY